MMLRIVTMLKVSREVEGYARSGLIQLVRTRRALSGLSTPVTPDVVVVDLHADPGFLIPGMGVGLGVLLLVLPLRLGSRRSPVAAETAAIEPVAEAGYQPEQPAPWRLPGLMLLNVDASADASAVEHAPPLGTRTHVAARLTEVFPGLQVAGDGRGSLHGEDWSLTLHLGADDTVWTVTVDARGHGAIAALETLAAATGWRMFVPKHGRFVNASELAAATAR
jgi:hypothetical protein